MPFVARSVFFVYPPLRSVDRALVVEVLALRHLSGAIGIDIRCAVI